MPFSPKNESLRKLLTQYVTGDVVTSNIYEAREKNISQPPVSPVSEVKADKVDISKEETVDRSTFEEGERAYHEALVYIKDAIAPAFMRVTTQDVQINDTFCKTLFTYAYPDFLEGNWLSPLVNWDGKFDISMFIYPTDATKIQKYLRRRLTELQSEKHLNQER